MNNFKSLKILDILRFFFERMHVDYPMMRKILQLKLTMDSRRVPTIFNDSESDSGNQFLKSLGIYALMGLILIAFLIGDQYIFQMSILYGIVMFIIMTSTISDFSSVLLDVRDNMILHTKPVDSRTINSTKVVHITLYLCQLTIAFTAIPMIVGLVNHGIVFFLLSIVILFFVNLLILIMTALVYILVLRFFDGEKLKDIINYIQILLSISMVVGYQVVARSFEFVDLNVQFDFGWWHVLMPPIWYGAIYEIVMHGAWNTDYIILAVLGVVVPIIAIILYIKLTPAFERNLEKLLTNNGKHKQVKEWWTRLWSRLLVWNKEERIFFDFTSRMLRNERDFKLKVYPSIGMALVFPFIFIINDLTLHSWAEIREGNMYFTMYFCLALIPAGVQMLQFSANEKGAWVFRALPVSNEAILHRAALKAFLVRLFIPVYLVLGVIFLVIFSVKIWTFLLGLLLATGIHSRICYRVYLKKTMPFSEPYKGAESKQVAETFALLVLALFLGVIQFIANSFAIGPYILIAVLVAANVVLWRK
ncbi:hypothetical protein [Gracilibacillus salinarum]|uniref:ABC transporter permease n=1 Tax=Gracilibacillus salinarum TaxID=2932255 RepID=A0ABY4GN75_9BACI|nr:hypothetical protein [Gracilibacillus salinarum]UOQ84802.1 hypothetical protein MUN87_19445 [Gracilibacillus salinarum]